MNDRIQVFPLGLLMNASYRIQLHKSGGVRIQVMVSIQINDITTDSLSNV